MLALCPLQLCPSPRLKCSPYAPAATQRTTPKIYLQFFACVFSIYHYICLFLLERHVVEFAQTFRVLGLNQAFRNGHVFVPNPKIGCWYLLWQPLHLCYIHLLERHCRHGIVNFLRLLGLNLICRNGWVLAPNKKLVFNCLIGSNIPCIFSLRSDDFRVQT